MGSGVHMSVGGDLVFGGFRLENKILTHITDQRIDGKDDSRFESFELGRAVQSPGRLRTLFVGLSR